MPDVPLAVDHQGNELIWFRPGQEQDLDGLDATVPLPLSLVVAQHEGETLLVFNRWRKAWELPGGMIDPGESPREAAAREFLEETGHVAQRIRYAGVVLFRLMPDHRLEHAAVYTAEVEARSSFVPNDEVEQVTWWDGGALADFAALDEAIACLTHARPSPRPSAQPASSGAAARQP